MNRWVTLVFVATVLLDGCQPEDHEQVVPEMPTITTSWLALIDGSSTSSKTDTLRLSFDFTDGIFDFGLNPDELAPPYHPLNFFVSDNGQTTSIAGEPILSSSPPSFILLQPPATQTGTFVTFEKLRKQNPSQTYVCGKFTSQYERIGLKVADNKFVYNSSRITETVSTSLGQVLILGDSFLIERNRNHYNLIVDYLAEQPDGSFQVFDWQKEFCLPGYHGRVPMIGKGVTKFGPFRTQALSDQRALVHYGMASSGFRRLFGGKRLKIRFSIIDRSLNESNVVETDPILVPKE